LSRLKSGLQPFVCCSSIKIASQFYLRAGRTYCKTMKQMLLLSNSVSFGGDFLGYCKDEISIFLKDVDELLFVPYAKRDYDSYVERASPFFDQIGIKLKPIHKHNPIDAINKAKAIYIPGGNTFRLLNELYKEAILKLLKLRIGAGVKYIGSSAGSIIACPTIRTTNDMPIVEPPSFNALNLIPFQLNCHYLDKDPNFPHNGESREMRIQEYHEESDTPVLGLREDSWLHCSGEEIVLKGKNNAVLFKKGEKRKEILIGKNIEKYFDKLA